jgi:hypothetical protein
VSNPELQVAIEKAVESSTRGDPMTPLLWTCKSIRTIAEEVTNQGHPVSASTVCHVLHEMDYSLQGNAKTLEGSHHEDRDAQFRHISAAATTHMDLGNPVISIDTKKKELVGQFKNGGKEWRPEGTPEKVNVHDFMDKGKGKVNPYGVYDLKRNEGYVNVGTDHDTAAFAVESIRRWWNAYGSPSYPDAKALLITADGGGSNGSRVRLWKAELQKFVDEIGIPVQVCHFPPGTSKWNKIEHRLFSHITLNWRGIPLVSHEVILSLISRTKTKKGLKVRAELDKGNYQTGLKVSDAEFAKINLVRDAFHGEWNYRILPSSMPPAG